MAKKELNLIQLAASFTTQACVCEKFERIMARKIVNVQVRDVEADEVWSFIGKKEKRVRPEDVHKSLRITPAMAAGVSDHIWSVREILEAA
jgi:hypothetical protein